MSPKGRHLVTGAAGVIGFELTRQLLQEGARVTALDDFRKGGEQDLKALAKQSGGRLEIVALDLSAEGAAARVPAGPFEIAFHLAAIVGVRAVNERPYEAIAVNVRSTLALLDWAITGAASAFLFASSSECYASGVDAGTVEIPTPEGVPLSIGDITLARWSYAASKIAGESAVFSAAREHPALLPLVVRFHNVYGPRMQPTHVVPEFLERCLRRVDPFPIYGAEQTRSFLHVEDAARAVRAIAATVGSAPSPAAGGIFHIGSREETRILDLAELAFSISGHRPALEQHEAAPGSVRRRVPDVSKLESLGFRPRIGLREGVCGCWEALQARK